jgi:predicted ArsR family transcriptional regulator
VHEPARAEEIADHLGIHPNSARSHLRALAEAGLVRRAVVPSGLGRPHFEWSVEPGGGPGGDRPTAYEDLATWLATALAGRRPAGHVERAGREIGRELSPRPGAEHDAARNLEATLSSMGFQPEACRTDSGVSYTLCNCPYRSAAARDPSTVCVLHRGITRGLLDVLAPEARLAEFVTEDPATAGCRVVVEGLSP